MFDMMEEKKSKKNKIIFQFVISWGNVIFISHF